MAPIETRPITVFVVAPLLLGWCIGQIIAGARPRIALAGSAATCGEALDEMSRQRPDVAVLLLQGEDPRSLGDFCARSPAKVIVAADRADDSRLDAAVRSGARGVLSLGDPAPFLIKAIDRVHDGELWIDRGATSRIFLSMARRKAEQPADSDHSRIARLTVRERETVAAVARQVSAPGKVIADRLRISEHTLRNHLSSIYTKLGVNSRLDLYAYATTHNLCAPE